MRNIENIPACGDCHKINSVFSKLAKDELNILTYEKGCNFYKRGNIIYQERNRISGVYCISKGIIKLYKTGIDGREQIIRFAQKGDIIGYRSILSQELACTTAKVIEDAVLCFIPANLFFKLVKENSDFSMKIMRLSLKELGEANKFIIDIAQKTVRERLAEILILLKDTFSLDNDHYLQVSLTREELANLVGTATESVIRLLSEFKSDKYIELNGRRIKILKIDVLKKLGGIN
ncbi:MAG: Crp/Fnr family transcriptional regulator [Bacteroidetes bacterium]|nr:MAG: Crp/Fnr family transcriptional regulator [Bacteroidota bacterium]